jgi:hypothetical protein
MVGLETTGLALDVADLDLEDSPIDQSSQDVRERVLSDSERGAHAGLGCSRKSDLIRPRGPLP